MRQRSDHVLRRTWSIRFAAIVTLICCGTGLWYLIHSHTPDDQSVRDAHFAFSIGLGVLAGIGAVYLLKMAPWHRLSIGCVVGTVLSFLAAFFVPSAQASVLGSAVTFIALLIFFFELSVRIEWGD